MSEPLDERFEGTWRFENPKEEEGWNYLHFSGGNRIVQFFNIREGSFDTGKMLVGDIGDSRIEFYPEGGGEGWTRIYRFDDGNLVIIEGEDEYPCSRLPSLPDWLAAGIDEAQEYFATREADWGGDPESAGG